MKREVMPKIERDAKGPPKLEHRDHTHSETSVWQRDRRRVEFPELPHWTPSTKSLFCVLTALVREFVCEYSRHSVSHSSATLFGRESVFFTKHTHTHTHTHTQDAARALELRLSSRLGRRLMENDPDLLRVSEISVLRKRDSTLARATSKERRTYARSQAAAFRRVSQRGCFPKAHLSQTLASYRVSGGDASRTTLVLRDTDADKLGTDISLLLRSSDNFLVRCLLL